MFCTVITMYGTLCCHFELLQTVGYMNLMKYLVKTVRWRHIFSSYVSTVCTKGNCKKVLRVQLISSWFCLTAPLNINFNVQFQNREMTFLFILVCKKLHYCPFNWNSFSFHLNHFFIFSIKMNLQCWIKAEWVLFMK